MLRAKNLTYWFCSNRKYESILLSILREFARQRRMEVDGGGWRWMEVDGDGRRWTEMDGDGRRWTEMDGDGRRWTKKALLKCSL